MRHTDVLVVGAGLAGLRVATLLAENGHSVVVIDRRRDLTTSIRTTGIFVRRTLDDYDLPDHLLGPAIRRVVLYPPSLQDPVELVSERDEYRVGEMGALYAAGARAAAKAGAELRLGTRYLGGSNGRYEVSGPEGSVAVNARFVVGADGARSRVARDLGLDRNTHLLVGAEDVFNVSEPVDSPAFHCVLDPRLAPGYIGWVINDGKHAHVGTAGYSRRFRGGVRGTLDEFAARAPGLAEADRSPADVERRGGPIPVGGLLRRISSPDGLLVGDAAGAVSPLTAGGLDPCLRLSDYAAVAVDEALRTGQRNALREYDGVALRRKFTGRLMMRHALAQVKHPTMASAGFGVLRTPFGRAAARKVLFGDRSFPDPPETQSTAPVAQRRTGV
ncbi:NAD(P)/FAD-dependent oxidoreductase [Nesterenkonia halotolerans]|uniref:Flavin-dependent dehydrogenase n=1 Tax=Nesterenkonia halotolerans TaxID=225325 RepID=A0ABR9J5H3_9MICC|nr:NAD(P)/FAD-dependent oxidoreductase [Nesterenkonia halotolerans]MBE1514107.1 flavin-dependent dehydrogenase [Nesterenkonia halotolerans]